MVREFVPDDTLELYAEVYAANGPVSLEVVTRIVDDGGNAVFEQAAPREREGALRDGLYRHAVAIPLKGIAAGRYTIEVTAGTPSGAPAATQRIPIAITTLP